jgi:hypothetical protein
VALIGKNCRIHVNRDLIGFPTFGSPKSLSECCLGYELQGVYASL